jgi:DNA-binding NtrC family response regulator
MGKPSVAILGLDELLRRDVARALIRLGSNVVTPAGPPALLTLLREEPVEALLLGWDPAGAWDGVDVAMAARRAAAKLAVILLTIASSEERAIAALRAGVADYLRPPFEPATVVSAVRRHLTSDAAAVGAATRTDEPPLTGAEQLVVADPRMRELQRYVARLAAADCPVLITGETGTGKELTAQLIHRNSPRRDRAFACINCAAIPDTLVESELFGHERGAFTGAHEARAGALPAANGGTVLLDEIGEMTPYAQAKLLRVIEGREVQRLGARRPVPLDIRVLAATNQDLEALVAGGRFRKDLYYRLNVARVHLPPLRDRPGDIPALVRHFCRQLGLAVADDPADPTLEAFVRNEWPGNVRELRNVLEVIAIASPAGRLSLRDLPPELWPKLRAAAPAAAPQPAAEPSERDRLLSTLSLTNWNKSRAAAQLRWSRMTLYRKLAKYGIAT